MFPNAPDQGTPWKNLRAVVLSALRSWVPKRWLWPTERVPLKRWLAPDITAKHHRKTCQPYPVENEK
jgi:hypothetical protein